MDELIFLQPHSILAISQFLVVASIAVYLLTLPEQTEASRFLTFSMMSFSALWALQFVDASMLSAGWELVVASDLIGGFALFGMFQFAYVFGTNPFRQERLVVTGVVGSALLASAGFHGWQILSRPLNPVVFFVPPVVFSLIALWTAAVFWRKRRLLGSVSPSDTELGELGEATIGRSRGALRAFAIFMFALALISGDPLFGNVVTVDGAQTFAFALVMMAFAVIYINHGPHPTTVQVRLVGLSLVTTMAALGVVGLVLFPEDELSLQAGKLPEHKQALRFQPDPTGGYSVGHIPLRFDSELGDRMFLGVEGDTLVDLGFGFPFYGEVWDHAYIDINGLISFGEVYLSTDFDTFLADDIAKIAPHYRAMMPVPDSRGGVFFKAGPDRAVVTWSELRERYTRSPGNRNTFQLVLYADGRIDFLYERLEAELRAFLNGVESGLRGIRPGGSSFPIERVDFRGLESERASWPVPPSRSSVVFRPQPGGAYTLEVVPFSFDQVRGEQFSLGDDTNARVELEFPFPFDDQEWTEAHVSANGAVAFGRSFNPPDREFFRPRVDYLNEVPKIAPLFRDLNPALGGSVWFRGDADRAVVTWDDVPAVATPALPNRFQVVLLPDGTVRFNYDVVAGPLWHSAMWGLHRPTAGPGPEFGSFLHRVSAESMPIGAALVEPFTLAGRRYVHDQLRWLAWLVVGTAGFILVIFPLFFRTSLVLPLRALLAGVERVDKGDLGARVPVRAPDELGVLAGTFNKMTGSLLEAEAELRAYAEHLEEKVEERTADLRASMDQLTEAQGQLVHAEKMASLGQLTAGIAHEMKNPLNFVTNFAVLSTELADELLDEIDKNRDKLPDDVAEQLDELLGDLRANAQRINEHGLRADRIVRSMLDHSRESAGAREATDLNSLVVEYLDLAYYGAQARGGDIDVRVEQDLDPDAGSVDMVSQKVGRTIINLLNNAFQSVRERYAAEGDTFVPLVSVTTERREAAIEVRIRDNGVGIPADVQQHIFQPFFTTKPAGSGTGLGLSLSYEIIVQGHGGELTVTSTEGEGAEFVVRLPVTAP